MRVQAERGTLKKAQGQKKRADDFCVVSFFVRVVFKSAAGTPQESRSSLAKAKKNQALTRLSLVSSSVFSPIILSSLRARSSITCFYCTMYFYVYSEVGILTKFSKLKSSCLVHRKYFFNKALNLLSQSYLPEKWKNRIRDRIFPLFILRLISILLVLLSI